MAAKPAALPNWNTDASNRVTPSGGQQSTGWTLNQAPTSGNMNWWMNLVYQWAAYVRDGAIEGSWSIINPSGETDPALTLAVDNADSAHRLWIDGSEGGGMNLRSGDFASRVRWGLDHNGYPSGQVSVLDQNWMTDASNVPEGWDYIGSVGSGHTYVNPTADIPARHALFTTDSGIGDVTVVTKGYLAYADANLCYVQEWDLRTGPVIDGGNAAQFTVGIQHRHASAEDWFHVFTFDKDVNTNWVTHAHRTTGGDYDDDSGIAVAINTTYRMRIEVHGQSVRSSGSNFAVRFYVNGALNRTREIDASADGIRPYFKLNNPGSDGPYSMRIGPVRCRWNHRLSPDAI